MMGLDAKLRSAAADNKASGSSSRLGVQSSDKVFDPKNSKAVLIVSGFLQCCGSVAACLN